MGAILTRQASDDYNEPNTLVSRWAEVTYFLAPTGQVAGNMPLYGLHRRVRVVVPSGPGGSTDDLNRLNVPVSDWGPRYFEVSCQPSANNGPLHFNSPSDLAGSQTGTPTRAFLPPGFVAPVGAPPLIGPPPDPPVPLTPEDGTLRGDDLVLSDVISFTVRILRPGNTTNNVATDFLDVPGGVYDTAPNPPYPILALEITLRIWDVKTEMTRQVTIIQDM